MRREDTENEEKHVFRNTRRPVGSADGRSVGSANGRTSNPAEGQSAGHTGRLPVADAKKGATGRLPAAGAKGATGRLPLSDIKKGRTGVIPAIREGELTSQKVLLIEREEKGFAPLRVIGNLLYALGFAGEYRILQIWRVLRDGGVFLAQVLAWIFGSLFGWLGRLFQGLWRDITAPFRHYRRRRRQLKRVRARALQRAEKSTAKTFFGVGAKSALQLLINIAGIILPVASAAVLLFTVYSITSMEYALAVNINGKVLGYVTDQNVVESAKSLLRDRLKLASNQELTDWQLTPSYSIARATSFTTPQQLVNNILKSGAENPGDLIFATAVYVSGELFAVTTEGERLQGYLNGYLERYGRDAQPGAVVSFVNDVKCDLESDDVFFAETVVPYDELIAKLELDLAKEVRYTATGDTTLELIAYQHGVTLDDLLARNPQLLDVEAGSIPETGTVLLIERAKPILQVQVAVQETVLEPVSYAEEQVETDDLAKGRVRIVQEGVDGEKEVVYDRIYVDGELDHSVVISETVITPAVNEITEVGTFVFNSLDPDGGGGGYIWPAPTATWSSRGVINLPYGHRGMDINGAPDSPLFAANTGVVVSAGYHWSWGYNVVIDHGDGYSTLYAHCSLLYVSEGDHVTRGDLIALMGSTGVSSGTHLHLEFFDSDNMNSLYDPLEFVTPPEGFDFSRW